MCVSFCLTDVVLWEDHLFVSSNLNCLHNSQWITWPTQSYLVLYCFCANLQHSLIMWLIVSSQSQHNLHLLFCCVFYPLRMFHTSVSWWSFTGVWKASSLLSSSPFPGLWIPFPSYPITNGIIVILIIHTFFLFPWLGQSICVSFRFFDFFLLVVCRDSKSTIRDVLF